MKEDPKFERRPKIKQGPSKIEEWRQTLEEISKRLRLEDPEWFIELEELKERIREETP